VDESFVEQEHPREDDGTFADKGGGNSESFKKKLNKDVEPDERLQKLQSNVESNIKTQMEAKIKEMNIGGKIKEFEMQGSFAKGTDLPKSGSDLDLFVVFNKGISAEDKDKLGLALGKSILTPEFAKEQGWTDFRVEEITATGKYAEAYFKKDGVQMEVQIVPTIDLTLQEINDRVSIEGIPLSGDDIGMARTPHQTRYMKEALKGKTDQVRMLKQFMKDTGLYDSSMKSQGFSGYSAEVLIDKFDNFDNVMDFFANLKQGEIVDKHGTGKPKEGNLFSMIDPIDKNRDLISAFSPMKIGRTIKTAQYYKTHGIARNEKIQKIKLDSVTVKYNNTQGNEDTLVGQSRSSQIALINQLKMLGFDTVIEEEKVNGMKIPIIRSKMNDPLKEDNEAKITIGVKSLTIPPTYVDKGMSIIPPNPKMNPKSWEEQLNNYKLENAGSEFIENNGRLQAVKKRQFTDVADALKYLTTTKLENTGLSKGTIKDMKNNVAISTKSDDDFENMF
jgi:tRNA nucleotidyltransferase (CCA-adding enzyme)